MLLDLVPDVVSGQAGKTQAEALLEAWDDDNALIVLFVPDPEIAPTPEAWPKIRENLMLVDAQHAFVARLRDDARCMFLQYSNKDGPETMASAILDALKTLAAKRTVIAADQTFIALMPNLHTPYRYPLHNDVFAGRSADLEELSDWALQDDRPVCSLIAMGGSGKSALAWRWATKSAETLETPFEGVFWWDFYHDSDAEKCAAQLMAYLTADPLQKFLSKSFLANVDALQSHLNGRRILICLDGVERILNHYREFDVDAHDALGAEDADSNVEDRFRACARQEGALLRVLLNMHKSKALLTSRLLPLDLERNGKPHPGLKQIDKLQMTRPDVRALIDALGVHASDMALDQVVELVAGHPLALRALFGAVKSDHGANLDTWLAKSRVMTIAELDLVGRRSHILSQALAGVKARSLALLGAAAAFRGPATLEDIVNVLLLNADLLASEEEVRAALRDLSARELLFLDEDLGECDMHPLVRGVVWKGLPKEWKDSLAERHGSYFYDRQAGDDAISPLGFAALQHLWFSLLERRRWDAAFEAVEPTIHTQIIRQGRAIEIVRMFDALRDETMSAGEPVANQPANQRECLYWHGFALSYAGRSASAGERMLDAYEVAKREPYLGGFRPLRSVSRDNFLGDFAFLCQRLALHSTGGLLINRYGTSGSDLASVNFEAARAMMAHDQGHPEDTEAFLQSVSVDHRPSDSGSWTFFRLTTALRLAELWLRPNRSEDKAEDALKVCRQVLIRAHRHRLREVSIRARALSALAMSHLHKETELVKRDFDPTLRDLDRALEEARRLRLWRTESLILAWRLKYATWSGLSDDQTVALAHGAPHFGHFLEDHQAFASLYAAAARTLVDAGDPDNAELFARRAIGFSLLPEGDVGYADIVSDCTSLLEGLNLSTEPIDVPKGLAARRASFQDRIHSELLS